MSQIHIGGVHRLNINVDSYDEQIQWINQRSKKFFTLLREIDHKKVLVRAKTRIDADKYVVSLLDLPHDTFFISKKWLVIEQPPAPIPCCCSITILVTKGCQCGAFKKENKN